MTEPDNSKGPGEEQSEIGRSSTKPWLVLLAVWAVFASVYGVIASNKLSHVQQKLAQAETGRHDEMTAALHRLLMDFQGERCKGASIHAFQRWLPLSKRSEKEDGTIAYSWTTKTSNQEGPGFCVITVDRDERVLTTFAGFPDW